MRTESGQGKHPEAVGIGRVKIKEKKITNAVMGTEGEENMIRHGPSLRREEIHT